MGEPITTAAAFPFPYEVNLAREIAPFADAVNSAIAQIARLSAVAGVAWENKPAPLGAQRR